ncbi:MAG: hypothetical protein JRN08_05635 [Nitrososphaerota archaeon]|nr:hypothetical protein [Nitrososphaerota archaeon]
MKNSRKSRRKGTLAFLIPMVIFVVIVIFGIAYAFGPQQGTIVIRAVYGTEELHVTATLNGQQVQTPYNATVTQGYYNVVFPPLQWYVAPPAHALTLGAGKTAYAVGVYTAAKVAVGVTPGGFNQTAVGALHGVTPVAWVNTGTQEVVVVVSGVGSVDLVPGQAHSVVFAAAGVYGFHILDTSITGTVTVY